MFGNKPVVYEEYLDIKNQGTKKKQKELIDQVTEECMMQIMWNAKEDKRFQIETQDLGNDYTRVRVRMYLVPHTGKADG